MSLLGVKSYTMAIHPSRWFGPDAHPIERDDLLLPDVIVEDYQVDVASLLRPVFDAVWQASGFPASQNYNEKGKWVRR